MILSYMALLATERTRVKATITKDHPASHYGAPVVVLPDGDALDYQSAILLDYHVESATEDELRLLEEWRRWMPPLDLSAAALGRKGGAVKSERKASAARENGKKGGRPRKDKAEK